jgi:hypothetical protein
MILKAVFPFVFLVAFCASAVPAFCQQPGSKTDTFLHVKKKGWISRLAENFSTSDTGDAVIIEKANPFFLHTGKVIRNIRIVRLGFERDINDTTKYNNNFGVIVANAFHKKTTAHVIGNNLFFETGDRVNPYLMADNERHLREQPFVQDALISIERVVGSGAVDVTVMVKDVFSLGGGIDLSSSQRVELSLKEENFRGSGSRFTVSTLYDGERRPKMGFGADLLKRNIKGTFVNWTVGFKTFNDAFNSNRSEESAFYTSFEKPFVSPYMPWMGALDLSLNKTKNNYLSDSLYQRDFKYSYEKVDAWVGYFFGTRRLLRKNLPGSRLRNFIAARGIYQHFNTVPGKVLDTFDYRYTNITGVLGSYSLFRQNFTRTNFIYGFGRNEDVPEGFLASVIAGYINKKDSLNNDFRTRPYYGFEGQRSHFNAKGFFSSYTLRIGGYLYKGNWEDVDILFDVDHFTKRKKLSSQWYYRQFFSAGITRQIKQALNPPLFLQSEFGLPYFSNGTIQADLRATIKTEAVFYNLRKFWGFRLAPFIFGDACLIKETNAPFNKSDVYSAIGAGVRTRNESLVFGTIELKAFYFPRPVAGTGMANYRIELGSNIRFKYSNILIRRPDFIVAN